MFSPHNYELRTWEVELVGSYRLTSSSISFNFYCVFLENKHRKDQSDKKL